MITYLSVNHYGCSYYCINEGSYIYGVPDNEMEGG